MLNFIPFPSGIVTESEKVCIVPKTIEIDFGGFEKWCTQVFKERIGTISSTKTNNEKNAPTASDGETTVQKANRSPWLQLVKNANLLQEAYILDIDTENLTIQSSSESGVIHALTTTVNLFAKTQNSLPCCHIEDAPKYVHRGLNFDCTRHFFDVGEVKKIIEEMALVKMNVFHWHLCDDQGWRIESRKFPLLQAGGPYYTREQIKDVIEFAALRGIEVIPEIDLPGHTTCLLSVYPQYSCFGKKVKPATGGGVFPIILCAGKEEVFPFLEELLGEILPLFPSPRCHIGGDEAPKSEWEKCPDCTRRMKELGLSEYEDLQGYFTERVCGILEKHGKQAVCWNETLLSSNAPKNLQIQYWVMDPSDPMKKYVDQGGQWIYSDVYALYFDYPHSASSLQKVYNTVPHIDNETYADSQGLLGIECCLWTEHIYDTKRLEERLFPRLFAVAETAWSGKREYGDFKSRLQNMLETAPHNALLYTPEEWWDLSGEMRRQDAFCFMDTMEEGLDSEIRRERLQKPGPDWKGMWEFWKPFFKPEDESVFREKITGEWEENRQIQKKRLELQKHWAESELNAADAHAAATHAAGRRDRKIIFLGSSVTEGSAAAGVSFVEYLAKRNGFTAVKEAVSGTTLVSLNEDSYIPRMEKLDTEIQADAFVCQLSTNDAMENLPLGTVSESRSRRDFETDTVAGAIEYIISYAEEIWKCPVVFFTGPKFEDNSNNHMYTSDNHMADAYNRMVELLLQLQKKWNIGVIDMWNDEKMNVLGNTDSNAKNGANSNGISREKYALYMADGIHPTQEGYLLWWTPVFEKYFMEHIWKTQSQPKQSSSIWTAP